jgi:hypothetical protein
MELKSIGFSGASNERAGRRLNPTDMGKSAARFVAVLAPVFSGGQGCDGGFQNRPPNASLIFSTVALLAGVVFLLD